MTPGTALLIASLKLVVCVAARIVPLSMFAFTLTTIVTVPVAALTVMVMSSDVTPGIWTMMAAVISEIYVLP